jgi:hypothetical protein
LPLRSLIGALGFRRCLRFSIEQHDHRLHVDDGVSARVLRELHEIPHGFIEIVFAERVLVIAEIDGAGVFLGGTLMILAK